MRYFDLHCDTITKCYDKKKELYRNNLQLCIEKGMLIDNWIQTYAVWLNDVLGNEEAYEYYQEVYQYFLLQIDKNKEKVSFCKDYQDMIVALAQHKKVAILSVEGSRLLADQLERVQKLYEQGVRMMTLTWNGRGPVGDGCMVKNAGGLTPFGRKVVCEMEKLGMLVDVSHLSEKGLWDVISLTNKPIVASHSNSKFVCKHPRNLTDEQFTAMVARKGLVGMNYYPLFMNGTMKGDIVDIFPHIDHFLELGGQEVIAMGSDFDGAKMPKHMKGIKDIDPFYHKLIKRYGKERAEAFLFDNAYHFMKENLI